MTAKTVEIRYRIHHNFLNFITSGLAFNVFDHNKCFFTFGSEQQLTKNAFCKVPIFFFQNDKLCFAFSAGSKSLL
jgi:hypothetical protein